MQYKIETANDLKPATSLKAIEYLASKNKGFYPLASWQKTTIRIALAAKNQFVSEKDFDMVQTKATFDQMMEPKWLSWNVSEITLIRVKMTSRIADDKSGHDSVCVTDSEWHTARTLRRQCRFALVDLERNSHQLLTLREMYFRMKTLYSGWTFVL